MVAFSKYTNTQAPGTTTPAQTAPGLDFDAKDVRDYSERYDRIPWEIPINSTLELLSLVNVAGRKCNFYKANVLVKESDSPTVLAGQKWALMYYYIAPTRTEEEEKSNMFSARELRNMATAIAGVNPKDESFNANVFLGELQKASQAGEVLGLEFRYQQQPFVKDGKQKSKVFYSPVEVPE